MAKLVIVIYNHNHGVDTHPVVLQDDEPDHTALDIVRADMVQEYGEEDVKKDEDVYGGFTLGGTIVNGTSYTRDNRVFTIDIKEETPRGK